MHNRSCGAEGVSTADRAQLARRSHGLSRQTVRRSLLDLVVEGTIHRVPGRTTFTGPCDGRYVRQIA